MKNKSIVPLRNTYINQDIHEYYELEFNGDIIRPGDIIKLKNDRYSYQYLRHAHNVKLDTTWVDAICIKTDSFHAFRIDQIRCVVRPKRSRNKK